MMYLAAHLHLLSIEALPTYRASVTHPVAVVQASRVLRVSPMAHEAGIEPGQSCATARAISPEALLVERDPVSEAVALRQIACCALRFTPQLSLIEPGPQIDHTGLILEIGHSLRLFGGAKSIARQLRHDLKQQGFSARLSAAPTPTGAWLLAQREDDRLVEGVEALREALCTLPIDLLISGIPYRDTLHSAGLRTVGQLLQLPRAGLVRRFGRQLLDELDRATGERPDHYPIFTPPPRFEAGIDLAAALEQTMHLLHAARILIMQLCGWLRARQEGALRIDLIAGHGGGRPPTVISVRLERSSRDAEHLSFLLGEHLQRCRLPAPVQSLQLQCGWTGDQAGLIEDLFPNPALHAEQISRLLERLQARLGHDQVQRLSIDADHRPERAQRSQPGSVPSHPARSTPRKSRLPDARRTLQAGRSDSGQGSVPAQTSDISGSSNASGISPRSWPLPRPLWLVDPPVALREHNNRPYLDSPMRLLAGPERIETGWWEHSLAQRDYFIAEDASHRLFWVFMTRLPKAEGMGTRSGWFLHGRYG
jgi:protein ImuB